MIYLLDTNVWIVFLRNPHSPVVARLRRTRPQDVCICSVVLAELYHGCLRSANAAANREKVASLVSPFRSLAFDDSAAEQYASIRHHLENLGAVIGPYDLQVSAIARAHGCTLVTHNTQEFGRVPGLSLEDWEIP